MSLSARRPDLPLTLAAGTLVVAVTAPMWRMGWLRDDWLFLWRALEPGSLPAGAGGVFPRPVADAAWRYSALIAGDSPWFMHVLVLAAWLALAAGLLRWHRAWGGGRTGALVAVTALVSHGALVEPRLWASGGNAVLAVALGIWGVWLMREDGARLWRFVLGAILLAAAILARADAVLLMALPLAERRGRDPWGWGSAGLVGMALLAWMMVAARGLPEVHPLAGARLLRLLLVPWGPPLPWQLAAVFGPAALAGLVLLVRRGFRPASGALLAMALAVVSAGMVTGWAPAGRYLLMPAVALALVLGRVGGWRRLLLAPWLILGLISAWFGNTTADLLQRSDTETRLYHAVNAAPVPLDRLVVQDPPALGWTGSAADAENVAGAARRRAVAVAIRDSGIPVGTTWAAARWDGHDWILTLPGDDPQP